MLRPSLLIAVAFSTATAIAAECPPVPKLTCEQLKERIEERCPQVEAAKPVTAAPRAEPKNVTRETPGWLVGGGPIFNAGWGLQAFAGYQWSSGWQLQIGPNWIDRDDKSGLVPFRCYEVPYTQPAPNGWGGALSLVKKFK